MDKQNNHYIPKCLIKRWKTSNNKNDGVYVLDLKSKTIDFNKSTGRKAFSFASVNDLYILTEDNDRNINLENWFDGLENSLSLFIDKVNRKETNLFKNIGHLNKLIMCLVSFEFRSRYFFEKSLEYLDDNEELRKEFNDKSSIQIILENVVNGTTDYTNHFFPVEFIIWESSVSILLCDRPLLFEIIDGVSFFPLTPKLLLSFKKTTDKTTINYQIADDVLISRFNQMIIEKARDWIVSNEKDKLEYIKNHNNFDQFDDEISINRLKTLIKGYEY